MGTYLYLEVDSGERLSINNHEGLNVGKALIAFLNLLSIYEDVLDDATEQSWFRRFETQSRFDLKILGNAVYSGNWEFQENEYERFLACTDDNPFKNEKEFREGMQSLDNKWTSIELAIEVTNEMIRVFKNMNNEEHWFTSTDVGDSFQGLLETLLLAKQRNGREIRIEAE